MRIAITGDVTEFGKLIDPMLRRDPLRHTVIATIIANRAGGLDNSDGARFLTVHEGDAVRGAAARVAGREIYLGDLPEGSLDAVVRALADAVPAAGGVEGAAGPAAEFARRWSELRGVAHRITYVNHLYRLDAVRLPLAAGSPRRAMAPDLDLCLDWTRAMRKEAGLDGIGWDTVAMRRRIAAGRWWLWEYGGRPVSLAAHQVPVHGWARIGPVYTPPAERGHGYASAVTAHVSHTLRTRHLDVCLFADAANPTSNKIYRSIGFRSVGEYSHYLFG